MPRADYIFPPGFLWGSATAAHQVEGRNTNNDWYAWEQIPGKIRDGATSERASDWWSGRWKEDFDRAAETGQNAHRLSIEWSRIQPAPDRWDEDALDHYRQIVRGLVQRNLTPMVTLHHFTNPIWLAEMGGWENPQTPEWFAAYTHKVVEALKDYVSLWCTINEPNVYVGISYMDGAWPPGKNDTTAAFTVLANLLRGHAMAYKIIHEIQKTSRVGAAHHYRPFQPARKTFPPDRWMTNLINQSFNRAFADAITTGKLSFALKNIRIPEAIKTQDFIGLNYYSYEEVRFVLNSKTTFMKREFPKGVEMSGDGMNAFQPDGMFRSLKWARSYGLPILITENGIDDRRDGMRPRYLVSHLHQVWRGVNFNWQIKGFFHWSLVDNFEWDKGWTTRFGLWGLDVDTQARIRRRSVDLYERICKENRISYDLVNEFTPELIPVLFPG
jgi:beta-glucosidase